MKKDELIHIDADYLVLLEDFCAAYPIKVDLVYAQPHHPNNLFKTAIYSPKAKMLAHKEMAPVILRAAQICFQQTGWIFEIKDCLRTVNAQELMRNTEIVKAHPHWLEEPNRLLSPPGKGGHPRGMAVDIILLDKNGEEVDMGTAFDFLSEDRSNNPAARNYTNFYDDEKLNRQVLSNRKMLENAMLQAGQEAGHPLLPLPQEWWDFRFMPDYSNLFNPIADEDLPPEMRMT